MALSKSVYLHMCVRTRVSGFASGIFCSWVRNLLTWLAGQWVCWYTSLKAPCPTPANPYRTPCTPHLIPLTAQTDATHPMPVTSHPTLHARHTSPKTAFPSLHSTPDIPNPTHRTQHPTLHTLKPIPHTTLPTSVSPHQILHTPHATPHT